MKGCIQACLPAVSPWQHGQHPSIGRQGCRWHLCLLLASMGLAGKWSKGVEQSLLPARLGSPDPALPQGVGGGGEAGDPQCTGRPARWGRWPTLISLIFWHLGCHLAHWNGHVWGHRVKVTRASQSPGAALWPPGGWASLCHLPVPSLLPRAMALLSLPKGQGCLEKRVARPGTRPMQHLGGTSYHSLPLGRGAAANTNGERDEPPKL